jgi:uncharacterized protein
MKRNRRDFLKIAGTAGIGLAGTDVLPSHARSQDTAPVINKVAVDHAVATLEDGSKLATPFWRIESGKDGPSLLLLAAQHGNEVQGAEVARRLMEICARHLKAGRAWLVPMANLRAIRARRHSADLGPEQPGRFSKGHNLQGAWPGDPQGNDTQRVAHALDRAVVRHCTHAVDLHCWNHFWAAETLAVTGHEPSGPLGEVTTTRFVSYRAWSPPAGKITSFGQLAYQRGAGAIAMELSGQFQMQERQVRIGVTSLVNIAKRLGMMPGEPEPIEGRRIERTAKNSHLVQAPCAGMFMPAQQKGQSATLIPDDRVEKGQVLGHIIGERDLATVPVRAPVSGYLWQLGACHGVLCDASLPAQHPYTEEGETLAMIVASS